EPTTGSSNKYMSHGIISKMSNTHVLITELPIHKWTEDYRSKVLKNLEKNGTIRSITRDNRMNERVHLEVELNPEKIKNTEDKGLKNVFRLTHPLATSNMMCFDPNNKLAKYESPEDILKEFYQIRLNLYIKRRVGCNFIGFFFIYQY